MSRLDEQRNARLQKLETLNANGREGYPSTVHRTHTAADALARFDELAAANTPVTIAGRIHTLRPQGGTTFLHCTDSTGMLQVLLKKDVLNERYKEIVASFDLGDIAFFTGTLLRTQKGEPTLLASEAGVAAKALRPPPDAHYGLKDAETRLRQRYLDLMMDANVRELFLKKARFWGTVRSTLVASGFVEVETPVLELVPGGAEARPFTTHHHALDQEMFLRISLELPLKRLLVGGFEKVFEIGRIFRNEGMSAEHLQDYTQMECYWAYADYRDLQPFVTNLYRTLAADMNGTLTLTRGGVTVDWGAAWRHYDYFEEFGRRTSLDLAHATDKELRELARKHHLQLEGYAQRGRIIDLLYKKLVRPHLVEPGFLMDPPVDVEPLAKRLPGDPTRVQRLQVVAWGTELGKGFSELNDPIDQRKRFEQQAQLRDAGDEEAQHLDDDFLEALEYGMPPAAGFGMSERLFAVFADRPVRETVLFPTVKRGPHA